MESDTTVRLTTQIRRSLTSELGAPGRVVLTSAMTGGLFFGGFLVALPTLLDRTLVPTVQAITQVLFVFGVLLGLLHGSLLGYLGRPSDMTRRRAIGSVIAGALWAVPCLAISYWITLWISISRWSLESGTPILIGGVGFAWLVAFAISAWCTREVWRATGNAVGRWQDRRLGTLLAALTFAVMAVLFIARRPEIWWSDVQVSLVGAIVLALGLTLWAALPIEVLLLHVFHRHRAV
jgi:hypothetical protein